MTRAAALAAIKRGLKPQEGARQVRCRGQLVRAPGLSQAIINPKDAAAAVLAELQRAGLLIELEEDA